MPIDMIENFFNFLVLPLLIIGISFLVYRLCLRVLFFNRRRIDYLGNFYKYSFNFSGKTKRKDFWITESFLLLISLFYLYFVLANDFPGAIIPFICFGILSVIPNIAIQVRRLRDIGKDPLWILIGFVPLIGSIMLLIFYMSPSRKKRLPRTLAERLNEVEDLLKKGTIDEEEYKYMRKKILTKYVD